LVDLRRAVYVGDDGRDAQAGEAAGVETILVDQDNGLLDVVEKISGRY
jgi:phosphoglycolate phosphatase-like HAD superfamily hydrolase